MLQEPIIEIILEDNTMTPEEMNTLVSNYKLGINKLNNLISEIQDNCLHKEVEIKNVSDSVFSLRRVCKTCQKEVGYPTQEELKKAGY